MFPETGRGIAANVAVLPQSTIIEIPLKLCIRKANGVGTPLEPIVTPLTEYIGTVFMLMYETIRGSDSFYQPFLAYLPQETDVVDDWSDEELAEFQDSSIIRFVKEKVESLRGEFANIESLVKQHPQPRLNSSTLTFELFRWAWNMVGSRSFGFFEHGTTEGLGTFRPTLVPIADFLNHEEGAGGRWLDEADKVSILSGSETYFRGQQIYISYGART